MEETLLDEKFYDEEGDAFHCRIDAEMDDAEPRLTLRVRVRLAEDRRTVSEMLLVASASNPLTFTAVTTAVATQYGLCVAFNVAGTVTKYLQFGYARSRADDRREGAIIHLRDGLAHLAERRSDLASEIAKTFVTCGQKLLPP